MMKHKQVLSFAICTNGTNVMCLQTSMILNDLKLPNLDEMEQMEDLETLYIR